MERIDQAELLDLGQGADQDVIENLAEMQRINDFLGGTRAFVQHLYPRLHRQKQPVTLVDLGSGGAGLPLRIAAWARRNRLSLRVLAVDWSWRNLVLPGSKEAASGVVQRLQADAMNLPLASEGADFIISTLFLHHLSPEQVVRVLRQSCIQARQGLVMSDLVRGWMPWLAFKLVQPVFARNFLTRHDGALSVRRAYTPGELLALAECAGLPNPRVYAHFPWRMTLVVDK